MNEELHIKEAISFIWYRTLSIKNRVRISDIEFDILIELIDSIEEYLNETLTFDRLKYLAYEYEIL